MLYSEHVYVPNMSLYIVYLYLTIKEVPLILPWRFYKEKWERVIQMEIYLQFPDKIKVLSLLNWTFSHSMMHYIIVLFNLLKSFIPQSLNVMFSNPILASSELLTIQWLPVKAPVITIGLQGCHIIFLSLEKAEWENLLPILLVCYCKRKKNDVNNKSKKILSSMESLGEPTDQNLKNGRNVQVVNNRAFALRVWWVVVLET